MGDNDEAPAPRPEGCFCPCLRPAVEMTGRLIEDNDRSRRQPGPGQGHRLALSRGENLTSGRQDGVEATEALHRGAEPKGA